jgi:hypothetical protein
MKTIILIGCVSNKEKSINRAINLYKGPLFKNSLKYANSLKSDNIFIISALHYLVDLEEEIAPYNVTLSNISKNKQKNGVRILSSEEKVEWGKTIINQLRIRFDLQKDKFIFLAGNEYIKPIIPYLKYWDNPMKGLKIGERIRFLKNNL